MGSLVTMAGVSFFGILLMLAISHSHELRPGRWIKISLSLPFLLYTAHLNGVAVEDFGSAFSNVGQYVFCWIIIAGIWKPTLSALAATGLVDFLYSPNRAGGGFRVDLKQARSLIEEDRLEDAIKELQNELKKESTNFEGRWLLAAIYKQIRQPEKGLEQIRLIRENSMLMPQQEENVADAEKELKKLQMDLTYNSPSY